MVANVEITAAQIWASSEPAETTVWNVCPYLRKECNHCPQKEFGERGEFQRGCYAIAAEICRVVEACQRAHGSGS